MPNTVPTMQEALHRQRWMQWGYALAFCSPPSRATLLATERELPFLVDPPQGPQKLPGADGYCGPTSMAPFSQTPPRITPFPSGDMFANPMDSILESKGASILYYR